MLTAEKITVLYRDGGAAMERVGSGSVRVVKTVVGAQKTRDRLLVAVAASEMSSDVIDLVKSARTQGRLEAFVVRDDLGGPRLFDRLQQAQLQSLRNTLVHATDYDLPRRLLNILRTDHPERLIAHALADGDELVVFSGTLERIAVPFASIPALAKLAAKQRAAFEFDDYGSHLYWPRFDLHMDLDALRIAIDPKAREKANAQRAIHDARFGAGLEKVRRAHDLTQADFAGVSERQIRRIEKGETFPRLATLRKIADAMGMDVDVLLAEIAQQAQ